MGKYFWLIIGICCLAYGISEDSTSVFLKAYLVLIGAINIAGFIYRNKE